MAIRPYHQPVLPITITSPNDSTTLNSDFVLSVFIKDNQQLWLTTTTGGLQIANLSDTALKFCNPHFKISQASKKITGINTIQYDIHQRRPVSAQILRDGGRSIFKDEYHRLWLTAPSGLFLLDSTAQELIYFNPITRGGAWSNVVSAAEGPENGQQGGHDLWLATYNGLGIFDMVNFNYQLVKNEPDDHTSLQPGRLTSVFKDQSGCMWIGSNGYGLSKFDMHAALFDNRYRHLVIDQFQTADFSVRSFYQNGDQLFIGTNDALFLINVSTDSISKIGLSSLIHQDIGEIFSITAAESDALWIASNIGLIWYQWRENKARIYVPQISRGQVEDNRIFKLFKRDDDHICLLTAHTFSIFNTEGKTFTHYFYNQDAINKYSEPAYGDICPDSKGNFWLGTDQGLLYFDSQAGTFRHYTNRPMDSTSISFNVVRSILPDPQKPDEHLWVGTAGGGLNKFDLVNKKFSHFTEESGLPNNVIYGILSDKEGNLWMSTNRGLSKFNPATSKFHNYDVNEGLQSNEFNSNAYYKNRDGKLFFGGIKGFNAFDPINIKVYPHIPPVVFTDFRLFNQSITGKEKNSPLQKDISAVDKIKIPYRNNVISFQVAALDFTNPIKNQFAYRLENFNDSWIMMGNNRLITFSNLDPGNYILHVKASNSDGVWNEKGISLALIITPPWYRTNWAYSIYLVIAVFIFLFFRRYDLNRLRLKNKLEIEHLETKKLRELDQLKSRFFANISHELRTPLTLILGPLEDVKHTNDEKGFNRLLPEMHRNAKRLLQLINQLLDVSKLDAGNYSIRTNREDIVNFLHQIVHAFSSLADRKQIVLETSVDETLKNALRSHNMHFYFDEDVLEKILYNLIGNAFKFTEPGGKITVGLTFSNQEKSCIELSVKDSGAGIPADRLPLYLIGFIRLKPLSSGSTKEVVLAWRW